MAVKIVVACSGAHPCLLLPVVTVGDSADSSFFAECAVVIVQEQEAGRRIAGHIDVRPAIVIEIDSQDSQSIASFCLADSRRIADIRERTVSVVSIEPMLAVRKSSRPATYMQSEYWQFAACPALGAFARSNCFALHWQLDMCVDRIHVFAARMAHKGLANFLHHARFHQTRVEGVAENLRSCPIFLRVLTTTTRHGEPREKCPSIASVCQIDEQGQRG